jgi:hypothetical protein
MERSSRARWLQILSGAALALGVSAGILLSLSGSGRGPSCASWVNCLVDPSGLLNAFHVGSAGALLVVSTLIVALSIQGRREDRLLIELGFAGLLVLLSMAALGALFATGAASTSWSAVQLVLLASYAVLNAGILVRARRPRSAPSRAGPPFDASETGRP